MFKFADHRLVYARNVTYMSKSNLKQRDRHYSLQIHKGLGWEEGLYSELVELILHSQN